MRGPLGVGGPCVVGPQLVGLPALLSLSWLSSALLLIRVLMSSIFLCVLLAFTRASNVSLALSPRFALLLYSLTLCSCIPNRLMRNANSLRRGSVLCAITW